MLFTNLFTYTKGKNLRRIAAAILLLFIILTPVQDVLTTPVVSIAHAQATNNMCSGTTSDCLGGIIYLFAVYIPTQFAYATGFLFNFALQLALNSAAYALDFLSLGWTVVRDIANLTFIFILIYIAYTIIMRAETSGTMRMLAWVIAMALLINFSFFITRIVIDAGNILAVQFYNALPISSTTLSPLSTTAAPVYVKDLTAGIMDAVKVQGILSDSSFQAFRTDPANSNLGFWDNLGILAITFISVGIFLSILGFMFLIVGIKFMVRIVVLWLTIVASPLAFAAQAVPNKKIRGYYQIWQDNLIQSSFYPAVFLFLFFIMTLFLQALAGNKGLVPEIFAAVNSLNATGTNSPDAVKGVISIIANVGVRIGLVTVLLYFAMKASDAFSSMGSGLAGNIVSWTGNKVAGTSAWLTRNSAGRFANTAARSATVRNWAAANPLYGGRIASGALNKVATSTLDVRGISGLKSLAGKAGLDLSGPGGKGGYRQQEADRAKAAEKFAKGLKSDSVYVKQNALREGIKAYEEKSGAGTIEELRKIQQKGIEAAVREYETKYDSTRTPGAFKEQMKHLEEARAQAAKDAAEFAKAGNKAEADKANALADSNKRKIAELDAASKKQYADAVKDLAGLSKLGENRIKDMDKERIKKAADYEESARLGNMLMPSVGNVEGAMKMNKVASGKTDVSEAAEHLLHAIHDQNGGGHAHGEEGGHKEEAKGHDTKTHKADTKKDAGHGDGHDDHGHGAGHHMDFKGIRSAVKSYGSNEAAHEEISEQIADKLKRLDLRMQNVQNNISSQATQTENVQQSINTLNTNLQRSKTTTPTSPTTFETNQAGKGTLRPTANTAVVPGVDAGMQRRMPESRGQQGAQRTIDELANSIGSNRPPSSNNQNPPKAA